MPRNLVRKLKHLGAASNSTVVLRQQPNRRRSSLYALANTRSVPSSEAGSIPLSDESFLDNDTERKISVDSGLSVVTNNVYTKRNSKRSHPWIRSSPDFALDTIDESGVDQMQATIKTVEKAAAAKIFLEIQFNERLNGKDPRFTRRQYLETQLFYSPHLTEDQKDAVRMSFCNQETWHMRETRVLKSRSQASGGGKGMSPHVENYEPLKILGKGSFGVVKLVREKSPEAIGNRPRRVYAMKVIKKSEMLRSSQEGHLRAERDFLVASEGAHW